MKMSKSRSRIILALIGSFSAFFASFVVFSTFLKSTSFQILNFQLIFEKEDLFGIVLFLVVISAAAFLSFLTHRFRVFWITFLVLLAGAVTFAPYPLIRISLYPLQERIFGHRFFIRGFNHGPNELKPGRYQPSFLTSVKKDDVATTVTCKVAAGDEIGPFGYYKILNVAKDESGLRRIRKDLRFEDVADFCKLGINLSFLGLDTDSTQILTTFIFNGEIKFDESELNILEGNFAPGDSMTPLARYLLFLKSRELANQVAFEQADYTNLYVSLLNSKYVEEDFLYSFYACDVEYYLFLQGKGLKVPLSYKGEFYDIVVSQVPYIDSSDVVSRQDPMARVSNQSLSLSIAEDVKSSKCKKLSEM